MFRKIDKELRRRFKTLGCSVSSTIKAQNETNDELIDGHNFKQSSIQFSFAPKRPLGARCRGVSLVKFPLRPCADFVELRVQPSDFGIHFDKVQAPRTNQLARLDSSIVLAATRFQAHAGGWISGFWVVLQIHEIETQSFHSPAIIPQVLKRSSALISTALTRASLAFRPRYPARLKLTHASAGRSCWGSDSPASNKPTTPRRFSQAA